MANKDLSKQWFQTGDFPTEAQFAQVFEWLRWKDELMDMSDVDGLTEALNSIGSGVEAYTVGGGWDDTYTIPSGYLLEHIIVVPVSNCYPYCSYVSGAAGDVIPQDLETIVGTAGAVWVVNIFAADSKVIEIIDLPATSKAYFLKRKIY